MIHKYGVSKLLEDVYYLPGEIAWLEDNIAKMKAAPWHSILQEIISLESARLARCNEELQAAMEIIAGVEDPMLLDIIEMHCLQRMSWLQIAREMPGVMRPAGYRQMFYRWRLTVEVTQ